MSVIRTEQSVDVPRAPASVFAFLDDPSKTPSWLSMCTTLEQTSPPPKGVGTTMRYRHNQGTSGGMMDGVVTAYEAGKRLQMTFIDKMFEVVVEFRVAPAGTGSRITYSSEITPIGFMAKMMSSMIRGAAEKQMAGDVAKLKALLSS